MRQTPSLGKIQYIFKKVNTLQFVIQVKLTQQTQKIEKNVQNKPQELTRAEFDFKRLSKTYKRRPCKAQDKSSMVNKFRLDCDHSV